MTEMKHTQEEMTAHAGAVTATVNGCRMYLASCTCNDLPADEQEANARLYAASHDLLAELRNAVSLFRGRCRDAAEHVWLSEAEDAIRKATRVPV